MPPRSSTTINEDSRRNRKKLKRNYRNHKEHGGKLNKIGRNLKEKNEEEEKKRNTITSLTIMNLIQSNENRKIIEKLKSKIEVVETKEEGITKYDNLKLRIKELGLKVIEFG